MPYGRSVGGPYRLKPYAFLNGPAGNRIQYLLVREIGRHAVEAFVCIHPALAEIQILNGQRLAKTLGYTK